MGEGTYANWGNTMMTLSSMTFFSAIAIEQAVFMSMFAYNYYSPQINNVLNSGADTMNKMNLLNYRVGFIRDTRGGLHLHMEYVADASSIAIPILNTSVLPVISSMTGDAIAMMASNTNGLSGGGNSSNSSTSERNIPRGNYAEGNSRGIRRQNESADTLAENGYDVEMLDEIDGGNGYGIKEGTNPDFKIGDKIYDCYSPEGNNNNSIKKTIKDKSKSQSGNIILNLDDYTGNVNDLIAYISIHSNKDLKYVTEIIGIKDGNIFNIFTR